MKYVICWRCITNGKQGRGQTAMSRGRATLLADLLNLSRPLFDHWIEPEE